MQIILYIIGANNLVKWLILITNFQLTVVQIMKSVYKFGIEQRLAGGRTWRLDVATFRLITVADCPPYTRLSAIGDPASPVAASRVTSTPSLPVFRRGLKKHLCKRRCTPDCIRAPLYPWLHQDSCHAWEVTLSCRKRQPFFYASCVFARVAFIIIIMTSSTNVMATQVSNKTSGPYIVLRDVFVVKPLALRQDDSDGH